VTSRVSVEATGTVTTNYLAVVGDNTLWPGATRRTSAEVTDDHSTTIMLVENVGENIHWMEPRDLGADTMSLEANNPRGMGRRRTWHGQTERSSITALTSRIAGDTTERGSISSRTLAQKAVDMSSIAELADIYLAGAGQLRAAVAGMSHEQLIARPVPGKWSTLEVVAHIADFEPIMADRMKRVIADDNPILLAADENLFAAQLFYENRQLDEELAVVDAIRASTARTLRQLPSAFLNRIGTHNEAGTLTLEQLIQRATNHVTHHVSFIQQKRAALA
jgi:uncharacterized damage-inducible protein DinB